MRDILQFCLLTALVSSTGALASDGYADPDTCGTCHSEIEASYRRTGMARTFSAVGSSMRPESWSGNNTFYHQASERDYTMFRQDGSYIMRRHQTGNSEAEVNVIERRIDFAVGSGTRARTFVHRTSDGRLIEMPVSWYSADGGYWAMSPGFDQTRHSGFRREISEECLFCHNAYPATVSEGLPQGIDCQRCHGPGRAHVDAAQAGAAPGRTRSTIVNPARLTPARQLEVCLQCHLETTSRPLPHAIRRFEREPFSYKPGEALGDFKLHFDHPQDSLHQDKFEVNSAGYRLLKSRCFSESRGELNCTTCHDPHGTPGGAAAKWHYRDACIECHASRWKSLVDDGRHPSDENCTACHMPKRRSEDAVHVVITDHLIAKRPPPGNPLAPLEEEAVATARAYTGPVVLYYPSNLPNSAATNLYLALAQVKDGSNLLPGIDALGEAISRWGSALPRFRFELANAYFLAGRLADAEAELRNVLASGAQAPDAHSLLGEVLLRLGRTDEAIEILGQAAKNFGGDAQLLTTLGVGLGQRGRLNDSVRILRSAVARNPDRPLGWINLGTSLEQIGDLPSARTAYGEAIRTQPDNSAAHYHLANLLLLGEAGELAEYHARQAVRYGPEDAKAHLTLGRVLAVRGHTEPARDALQSAIDLGNQATRDVARSELSRLPPSPRQ